MNQNEREIETLSGRELLELLDRKKPSAPEGLSSQEHALWGRVEGAPLEFVIAARHRVDADRRKALDALDRVDKALAGNWGTLPAPPDLPGNALKRRAKATLTAAALDIPHHHERRMPRAWQKTHHGAFLVEAAHVLDRLLEAVNAAAALQAPKYLPDTSLVVEDGTFTPTFHEEIPRMRALVATEIAAHDARVKDWAARAQRNADRVQPFDEKAAVNQWLARCRDMSPSVTWSIAAKLLWLLTGEEVDSDALRHRVGRK